MIFSKLNLVICLTSLLLGLVTLVACNQTKKVSSDSNVITDTEESPIFSMEDVSNAIPTTVSETIDLLGVDLNNEEINIEGAPAPEEDSEIETLDVLNGVDGYLTYYRYNGERYHIWTANQATDVKKFVHSTTRAIQSVAVSGDGNWVAASMIEPNSGKYDIYLFDVVGVNTFNLTNTASKDELDVSMTADAKKIVFSRPTNAGLSKIRICDYNVVANSCTISTLGATENQRQASITGNGDYIALIRDINPNVLWRVLLYDVSAGTYQIVTTRSEELSHPSASADGNIVMYLRDRTGAIGKYMIRMKNLTTNVIDNELTKPELGHPHMTPMANYAAYRDISSNGWSRPFTRNIASNARASAHSGDWNYFAPYWQVTPVFTTVIYVNVDASLGGDGLSWGTAFRYLQDGMAATVSFGIDEIWIAEGVYYPDEDEGGNVASDRTDSFNLPSNIRIYGGFNGTEGQRDQRQPDVNITVLSGDIDDNDSNKNVNGVTTTADDIQGDNSFHVVYSDGTSIAVNTNTIIDGLTITGGLANNSFPQNLGGGMYCDGQGVGNECSPTLNNLNFIGNRSSFVGGAMYNDGSSSGSSNPTLTNTNFIGNQADIGGAMFNDGFSGTSSPILINVYFIENQAKDSFETGFGGAMFNRGSFDGSNSSPTLINVNFIKNQADASGGGMYNDGRFSGTSNPILTNVSFTGNQASFGFGGGAMYNDGSSSGMSSPTLTNVRFTGNQVTNGTGGGAMYNDGDSGISSPILTNVSFAGNEAILGGAIYNDAFNSGSSNPTIQNTIFWGNTANNSPEILNAFTSTSIISYSLFEGSLSTGSIDNGNNIFNVAISPFTTDPSPAPSTDGNLQLKAGAPAINAGNNNADLDGSGSGTETISDIATDLAGNSRIVNGTIDMGAYEKQ